MSWVLERPLTMHCIGTSVSNAIQCRGTHLSKTTEIIIHEKRQLGHGKKADQPHLNTPVFTARKYQSVVCVCDQIFAWLLQL